MYDGKRKTIKVSHWEKLKYQVLRILDWEAAAAHVQFYLVSVHSGTVRDSKHAVFPFVLTFSNVRVGVGVPVRENASFSIQK